MITTDTRAGIAQDHMALSQHITFAAVTSDDFDALVVIRTEAMRESLERVGRFDPARARERLRNSFHPEHTRWILINGEKIGFYTFRPQETHYQLDHLYVTPAHQTRGLGSHVIRILLAHSDSEGLPVHLGALKESAANRFYRGHGFVKQREDEWDVYYIRPPHPGGNEAIK